VVVDHVEVCRPYTPPDPPCINDIAIAPVDGQMVVTWRTDRPAGGEVSFIAHEEYRYNEVFHPGLTTPVGTQHRVQLAGLTPGTAYTIAIRSWSVAGWPAVRAPITFVAGAAAGEATGDGYLRAFLVAGPVPPVLPLTAVTPPRPYDMVGAACWRPLYPYSHPVIDLNDSVSRTDADAILMHTYVRLAVPGVLRLRIRGPAGVRAALDQVELPLNRQVTDQADEIVMTDVALTPQWHSLVLCVLPQLAATALSIQLTDTAGQPCSGLQTAIHPDFPAATWGLPVTAATQV